MEILAEESSRCGVKNDLDEREVRVVKQDCLEELRRCEIEDCFSDWFKNNRMLHNLTFFIEESDFHVMSS